MLNNAVKILAERGFIEWCSDFDDLGDKMTQEMITGYVGFDPSADSLHVGKMVRIRGLACLQG